MDVLDAAAPGSLVWHCSEEDSGPDIGVSIKLGDHALLWCGEITSRLYAETEGAAGLGGEDGWWIILYEGEGSTAIAKCVDAYAAKVAFERLSFLLLSPPKER